jgi:hypothetical protein
LPGQSPPSQVDRQGLDHPTIDRRERLWSAVRDREKAQAWRQSPERIFAVREREVNSRKFIVEGRGG